MLFAMFSLGYVHVALAPDGLDYCGSCVPAQDTKPGKAMKRMTVRCASIFAGLGVMSTLLAWDQSTACVQRQIGFLACLLAWLDWVPSAVSVLE